MRFVCVIACILAFVAASAQIDESKSEIRTERAIEASGHITHLAMPIATGLTTILIGDHEGGWQFAKSFGANLVATYTLKYAFDKPRPEGAVDGLAFPSGHTSVAFHSAAFIQRRYGWKYGIPAYLLAGFVGFSRVEDLNDRHDVWDVLGGIIVGVGSSYLFAKPQRNKNIDLVFGNQSGYYTVGLAYRF